MGNEKSCICYCNKLCFCGCGKIYDDVKNDITQQFNNETFGRQPYDQEFHLLQDNNVKSISKTQSSYQNDTDLKINQVEKNSVHQKFVSTAERSEKNHDTSLIFMMEDKNDDLLFDSQTKNENKINSEKSQTELTTSFQVTSSKTVSQTVNFNVESSTHSLVNPNKMEEQDLMKKNREKTFVFQNGNVEFRGTVINGKRNGYGIEYYNHGRKKYEGIWIDGNYNIGKFFNSQEILYMDGIFSKNCFTGKTFDENGKKVIYEGTLMLFDGEWLRHGKGKFYFENGIIEYDGYWEYSDKNGFGKLYHYDGKIKYDGAFKENKYFGFGNKYDLCGILSCEGEWFDGELNDLDIGSQYKGLGYSKKKVDGGDIYVGQMINEKRHGFGITYSKIFGIICEEGKYRNDKLHGFVKGYHSKNHKALWTTGYCFNGHANSRFAFYYDNGK